MRNTWIFTKSRIFKIIFVNFLSCLFIFPIYANSCRYSFTRRVAERKFAIESFDHLNPTHSNFREDKRRVEQWDTRRNHTPNLLKLPQGVHYIDHRLEYSPRPYLVRLEEGLNLVSIARAHYMYNNTPISTDVVFGKNVFRDHLSGNKQWLISPKANAAVLMLHGGGTRTTGSSVFAANLAHFIRSGIEGLSIDLPMHARGSRHVLRSFKDEILSIGAFARKYIPPHVPLFVYGHSWGAVFADELMRMTGEYEGTEFFHPSLKGAIITSPAVDTAPGKSVEDKVNSYIEHNHRARSLAETESPKQEQRIWPDMIRNGKLSLLGGIFLATTLNQIDQTVPEHKGEKYIPALMIVGTGDSLVYLGFEEFFHNYYDQLENVETHYLDSLPYIHSKNNELTIVGHLLTDYQFSGKNKETGERGIGTPVNLELAVRFIARQLNTTPGHLVEEAKQWAKSTPKSIDDIASIQQVYSNNLAFREFTHDYNAHRIDYDSQHKTRLNEQMVEERTAIFDLMRENLPKNRLLTILRQIAVTSSPLPKRKLQSFQESMVNLSLLRNVKSLPVFQKLLTTDNVEEAKDLAREVLRTLFLELPSYEAINVVEKKANQEKSKKSKKLKEQERTHLLRVLSSFKEGQPLILDSELTLPPLESEHIMSLYSEYKREPSERNLVRVEKERDQIKKRRQLLEILDSFPFKSGQAIPIDSEFSLSLLEKEHIMSLYRTYIEVDSEKAKGRIVREINQIINVRDVDRVLYHTLIRLSQFPGPLRKYHQQIREYQDKLSPLSTYKGLVRALNTLIKQKSDSRIISQALSIIKDYPALPITLSYSVFKPESLMDEEEFTKDDLISYLEQFQLPKDIQDQIVNIDANFVTVKNLIFTHSPIAIHYNLIQVLRGITAMHTLERFIEVFPSGLDDTLREVVSGKLDPYSVTIDKYYSGLGDKAMMQLRRVLQGQGSIHTLLDIQPLDEEVKTQMLIHYNNYKKNEDFINMEHIPTIQDFAESKGMQKEDLTSEQLDKYSEQIRKIEENVATVKHLKVGALNLFNERKGLLKKIRKSMHKMQHHIRLVRDAFNQVLVDPPESMRKKVNGLRNDFDQVEQLASKWVDLLDQSGLFLLSGGRTMTEESFDDLASSDDIENANREFEKQFVDWKDELQLLHKDVIIPAVNGEMGVHFQQAFQGIYGKEPDLDLVVGVRSDSDYSTLDGHLSRIAKIEEDMYDINEELAQLALEYNKLYPAPILVILRPIQPLQILNPTFGTPREISSQIQLNEYIKRHGSLFEDILTRWNDMQGAMPPTLPNLH